MTTRVTASPTPDDVETVEQALVYDHDARAVLTRLLSPPAGRRQALFTTPSGEGVAVVSVSSRDPAVGHLDLLAVRPSAQRQGVGRRLVVAAEEWLAQQGARHIRIAGNPPCYGWPGIDVRYTAAACLAEKLGYALIDTAWNMTADLSGDLDSGGDEERLVREGVRVQAASGELRSQAVTFARQQWNGNWAWEVEQATGCHVAIRAGAIVGFAAWGARPNWFGPMGTAASVRGLGIGRVLLRRCLHDMREAGALSAEISWVGPKGFYSDAVGAATQRVFWLYGRDLAL